MKYVAIHEKMAGSMTRLWNQEIGQQFPMREELLLQNSFREENVLPDASFAVLNEEEEIVAFLIAKKWQEEMDVNMPKTTGWIQALIVDSNFRKQGIGTELLTRAEQVFQRHSLEKVLLASDPWHYFPGMPEQFADTAKWFEKRGYSMEGQASDLVQTYETAQQLELPTLESGTFAILQEDEQDDLIDFMKRCFPGRWEYETRKYFSKGGTGREFVVLKRENKIIAFAE